MSEAIQRGGIASLVNYKDDEAAIKDIVDSWLLKDSEIRKSYLVNLKKARDSWEKLKKEKN